MNLLPLCQQRQALRGTITPARRFERILVRMVCGVNESSKEKRARQHAFPNLVHIKREHVGKADSAVQIVWGLAPREPARSEVEGSAELARRRFWHATPQQEGKFWGGKRESNPQPSEPQSGALPVELFPPPLRL